MQQRSQTIPIPINIGSMPDWSTRLGYPNLTNMFIGDGGYLYPSPGFQILNQFISPRAIHYSIFNRGSYFIVLNNNVTRVTTSGSVSIVGVIGFSGLPVQMDENLQNQITIVDGVNAYVYDQNQNKFTVLGETQGFTFESPCSVLVLNTFTIILDKNTGGWVISATNNALAYPTLDNVPAIESQLTEAVALETLSNNLYIFGTTGIERWQPNFNLNQYLFPFQRDNNFRTDWGAIATNSVIRGLDTIYFLSNKFVPMELTQGGIKALSKDGKPIIGQSLIISQYPDVKDCFTSFFSYRGNYFAAYTFVETGLSWVWCVNSQTWCQWDDLIIGSVDANEIVLTSNSLAQLSLTPNEKKRTFVGPRIVNYKGQQNYRDLLNGVECRIVQGFLQTVQPQYLELSISTDSQSYLNTVRRPIGPTGRRNAITVWRTNIAAYEFTPKIEYYGDLDFIIELITMTFN